MAFSTLMVLRNQLLLLIVVFMSSENIAKVLCPEFVLIERGTQFTICCNMTNKSVFGVYWYRGSTMTTSPLLQYENGKPGGSAYNSSDYDISSSGNMIIKNATVGHEDTYTLVVYFLDRTYESSNVTINVKIIPDPPCPSVTGCYTCGKCNVNITDRPNGDILCSISSSRPQVLINWTIKSKTTISFAIHRPIIIQERNSYSWITTVRISYESYLCGAEAVVQCIAQDDYRLLKHSSTTVSVFNAECEEDLNQVMASNQAIIPVAITIGVVAILLVIVTVVGCYLQKASFLYTKVKCERSMESSPSTLMTPEVSQLISCLKESYIRNGAVKVVPHANLVPPDVIYPPCECKITKSDGQMTTISSYELLTDDYIRKRVLITKYPDCDLTMYVKQVVQQWIQEEKNNFFLIFISLKDFTKNMRVANIVKENILMESDFSTECIEELIKQHTCLVVLHGVHEMTAKRRENTMQFEEDHNAESEKITPCTSVENFITLNELLSGRIHEHYNNVHVWMTACEASEEFKVRANADITVQISSCLESQMKEYINRTCTFYTKSRGMRKTNSLCDEVNKFCEGKARKFPPISSDTTVEIISPAGIEYDTDKQNVNNETKESTKAKNGHEGEHFLLEQTLSANASKNELEEIGIRVREFLEERAIVDDFLETPYLLMLLIHIIVENFLSKITEKVCVPITSTAMLVEALVTCLKDMYYAGSNTKCYTAEELNTLFVKVSEIAFQFILQDTAPNVECLNLQEEYHCYVNTGLAIGWFQLSQRSACDSKKGGYLSRPSSTVFCHSYIQSYFTAYNINQQSEHFNTFTMRLGEKKNCRIVGVLKFSALLEKIFFKDLCKALQRKKLHGDLFTCLHEQTDHEIAMGIIRTIKSDDLHNVHLSSKHEKESLKSFCRRCCEMNLTLKSITFTESCDLSFLKSLELPDIKKIRFVKKMFDDEDFTSLIVWVDKMKKTSSLWFVECGIPEKVTTMSQKEVQQLSTSELEVCRKKRVDDSTRSILEFKRGMWKLKLPVP